MKRIAIGIPSQDTVQSDFAMSLALMMSYTAKVCKDFDIVGIINQKTSIIQKGRSEIVDNAMALKADYILFLDSDMTFPFNTLEELLKAGTHIIGTDYATRREPYRHTMRNPLKSLNDDIGEVEYIGTGVLLVHTSVFAHLGQPYFDVKWDNKQKTFIGEDYGFCDKARKNGYKVYCHYGLSKYVGHLGLREIRL